MPERNKTPKPGALAELERVQTEILVAETRAAEPFVKTFSAAPENVATEHLGSLLGVFEIDCEDEDAAYIVNFLVSVAKKEYFSNPRRGAIESFESTLHKINLALTELVKHGNVSWLGRLHGAIGIIEKNSFHFSATGEGSILLLRGDACTDISEGLASPEALEHPLKTFVEISSGRLMADDTVILTSPELLALFPLDILVKNQKRFGKEGFRQFLRTALVNELDRAATLVLDLAAPTAEEVASRKRAKRQTASPKRPVNVFSGATFVEANSAPKSTPSPETTFQAAEEEPVAEYTDEKTGHIYVQGETPEIVPTYSLFWENVRNLLSDAFRSAQLFFLRSGRSLKRYGKKTHATLAPRLFEAASGLKGEVKKLTARSSEPRITFAPDRLEAGSGPAVSDDPRTSASPSPEALPSASPAPKTAAVRERLSVLAGLLGRTSLRRLKRLRKALRRTLRDIRERLGARLFYGAAAGIGALCVVLLWFALASGDESPEQNAASQAPVAEESAFTQAKNAVHLSDPALLGPNARDTRVLANLNDHLFAASGNQLIDIETGAGYRAPDGGLIRSLAAMDDLNLLFLYTEAGHLYSWSPFNKTYTENSIALPEGSEVREIGSYLTYLYILDPRNQQIHRLPRAETGFGEAAAWLREPVELHDDSLFVINETIVIAAGPSELTGYFQGKQSVTFEKPEGLQLADLFTEPNETEVYGLDTETGRIILWNTDGKILRQFFHPELKNATAFGVDTAKAQIIVAGKDGRFFSFSFTKN